MSSDAFSTYFVCLGNRCRSPFAEHLWRQLTDGLPVEVGSAGTLNRPGMESPSEIHEMAAARGLEFRSHRSRPLLDTPLQEADLVLGFELDHVAGAVVAANAPTEKTFKLGELVRLLREVDPPQSADRLERARALVAAAHLHRQETRGHFDADDVADPFHRPMDAYRTMATRIDDLLVELKAQLFGP